MCIMFYTTKKIGLPSDETLKYIFKHNPDGAGMLWAVKHGGRRFNVGVQKGIMRESEFITSVHDNFNKLKSDDDYFIAHTRISTSGGKTPEMTHPFALPHNSGYLFHNGICTAISAKYDHVKMSDTEYLAKNYLGKAWLQNLDQSSRFAIVKKDGHLEMLGNWVTDTAGIKWSNSGYVKPAYNYKSSYYAEDYYGGYYGNGYAGGVYNHGTYTAPFELALKDTLGYQYDTLKDLFAHFTIYRSYKKFNNIITDGRTVFECRQHYFMFSLSSGAFNDEDYFSFYIGDLVNESEPPVKGALCDGLVSFSMTGGVLFTQASGDFFEVLYADWLSFFKLITGDVRDESEFISEKGFGKDGITPNIAIRYSNKSIGVYVRPDSVNTVIRKVYDYLYSMCSEYSISITNDSILLSFVGVQKTYNPPVADECGVLATVESEEK